MKLMSKKVRKIGGGKLILRIGDVVEYRRDEDTYRYMRLVKAIHKDYVILRGPNAWLYNEDKGAYKVLQHAPAPKKAVVKKKPSKKKPTCGNGPNCIYCRLAPLR